MLATEVPSLQNGGVSQDGLTWRVKLRDDLAILPMFQYGFIEGTKKGLLGYVNNPNVVSNAWNIRPWRWQA